MRRRAKAGSPFRFTEILKGDAGVFRFFKLLGCTNEHIEEVLAEVENIQSHMPPVLHDCLRRFLEENADPEEWEYSLPKDQIDVALIHAYYFSRRDIDACLAFDVSTFGGHANAVLIRDLFATFQEAYQVDMD